MKTKLESPAQPPKELLEDLRTLVAEAEKMMGDTASEATEETVTALRERFESARARIGELYTNARGKVIAGAKCTDTAIRENPYQSLAIALGVGVLVGVLVGRRTK